MDLVVLSQFSSENDNFKFLFNIVDVYSKFCFVKKLHTKSAIEVTSCLKELFMLIGPPEILQSDNGLEFKNQHMVSLCTEF